MASTKKAKNNKNTNEKLRKFKRWFWGIFFGIIIFMALWLFFASKGWLGFMPSLKELENPNTNLATQIISSDGVVLGTFYYENRTNVNYSDLSPEIVNALIATEDERFYEHSGIDFKALGRAMVGMVTFKSRGGGSTITQQLAKNLFPRGKVNFFTLVFKKVKEWVVAVRLEKNYSKEEILTMYLNTAAFGNNAYGIKAASNIFFNKEPIDLNAEEAALLVGLLKGPTYYNPNNHYERALNRRNVVLSQMHRAKYLPTEVYDSIKQLPIDLKEFKKQDHTTGLAKHFRELVRSIMTEWCKNNYKPDGTPYNLYSDGLKIYVTIDSRYQKLAEEAVAEYLGGTLQPQFFKHWEGYTDSPFDIKTGDKKERINRIINAAVKRSDRYRNLKSNGMSHDSIDIVFNTPTEMTIFTWEGNVDTVMTPLDSIWYYKHFLRSGLMSVEPSTGHVKAYVCAPDYNYFKYDNVTQMKRQVGSTFKPFVYTLAMQEGEMSPCSKLPNVQVSIKTGPGQIWEPRNGSKKHLGEEVTLKWALAQSNNWISGALIKKYGPEPVIQMARKMGVKSDIPNTYSIALGSADLSLYEMVGAMNTFANKGVYIEPLFITKIADKNGNLLETFVPETNEAMSEETAYLMIELMKGVVESGTGVRLRYRYGLNNPIAGKTGTTNDNSDGWFMGITPKLVTGVWTGCEDRDAHFRAMSLGQGANTALPIWAIYMKKLYEDPNIKLYQGDFEKPIKPLSVNIDCSGYEDESYDEEEFIDFDEEYY